MPKKPNLLVLPFLKVDHASHVPLNEQIYTLIRDAIRRGVLKPGLRLPSSREISIQARVGRNTATHALDRLGAEGFVRATSGSGTYVSFAGEPAPRLPRQPVRISEWARTAARGPARPPCAFDQESFPWKAWREALAAGWRMAEHRTYLEDDAAGLRSLRDTLAECVAVMRGTPCSADEVIVTTGAPETIAALARLVADPGDSVVTDSADPLFEQIFRTAGLLPKPATVDDYGFDPADPATAAANVAVVVPSCEGPAGTVMAAGRRYAVIEWAKKHGTAVIEYDFDAIVDSSSELPPTLKSIDRRNLVAFVGAFDSCILPQVRIGFAVVPAAVREAFLRIEVLQSIVPSPAEQLALAWFIRKGLLARHVRRVRKINEQRRKQLVDLITLNLAGSVVALRPRIPLQLELTLSPEHSASEVTAAAAVRGIAVRASYGDTSDQTLIVDYGRLATHRIAQFVAGLTAAFEDTAPPRMQRSSEPWG